jgi:hypothetical protein
VEAEAPRAAGFKLLAASFITLVFRAALVPDAFVWLQRS